MANVTLRSASLHQSLGQLQLDQIPQPNVLSVVYCRCVLELCCLIQR